MKFVEAIRLALLQIRVQKLKSFFTLLGVCIGVMFLIAVVSIVEGMGRFIEDDFVARFMGVNTFHVRRTPDIELGEVTDATQREWDRRPEIRASDVMPIAAALPSPGVRWATIGATGNATITSRQGRPRRVDVTTVDGDYFAIKKVDIARGRVFSPQEAEHGMSVLIIGDEVAQALFPSMDAVGREVRVNNIPYRIIGVAEKQGDLFGISLDKFVIAPQRSPLERLYPPGVINSMLVQAPSTEAMNATMERVRQVMRGRHKLRPSEPDDFALETSASALEFWANIKKYLVLAGVVLPAISLVVGALVIMNIMLVAVAERTREIGIRKALGARRRDILSQFLVEAATLSTAGAALGILFGIGLSQFVAAVSPLPASVAPWSVAVAVVLGTVVGIGAGLYPASRAARLDPIAALRQE
ncbi:MAG: ABC transporter permease [Gemmatimonadaceae bacterium]